MGLTQKELGSLAGVDRGAILGWEKGKFKPREEKVAQLAALAKKGKEEVKKLLGEKMAKQEAKSNSNRSKKKRCQSKGGQKTEELGGQDETRAGNRVLHRYKRKNLL